MNDMSVLHFIFSPDEQENNESKKSKVKRCVRTDILHFESDDY